MSYNPKKVLDYVPNGSFDGSVAGSVAYADAAATAPVDGTGGSPTVTVTRTTSSPLMGAGSLLFTKDAANRQGQGFSVDFTIADKDKGKVLTLTAAYAIASGTYVDDDMSIWVYDVTNGGSPMQVAPTYIKNVTVADSLSCQFQTPINSNSLRLIFHVGSTSASAYTVKLDDISITSKPKTYGPLVTTQVAYTPTFTGFGIVSSVNVVSWRDGAFLKIQGRFTAGTTTATEARISLGFGGVDSNVTSKSTLPTLQIVGVAGDASSSATFFGVYTTIEASKTYITFSAQTSTTNAQAKANGSNIASSSVAFSFETTVPIEGWETSAVLSQDADTRVVAARVGGDPASASSGNPIIFPTVAYDTHGAYDNSTGRYTAPVPGYYRVHGHINSANTAVTVSIFVNASSVIAAGATDSNGEGTYSGTVKVFAGDLIDLRPGATLDATATSTIHFEMLQGPAQVGATETIAAKYTSSAGNSIANSGTTRVDFATKKFDTHSAVTVGASWVFTAPASGIYDIESTIKFTSSTYAAGNVADMQVFKSGSLETTITGLVLEVALSEVVYLHGSTKVSLLAGETLDIRLSNNRTAGATSLTTTATDNSVTITRVGNYA